MQRILNPGNDVDCSTLLVHGRDVVVKKVRLQPGAKSPVPVGTVREGKIAEFTLGNPVHVVGPKGAEITELRRLQLQEDLSSIRLVTQTSVWDVTQIKGDIDHRKFSLLFNRHGYLDFHEKMPDGFYDGGRDMDFILENGVLKPRIGTREFIVMNSKEDQGLPLKLQQAKTFLSKISREEAKITALALFVSNGLGGTQPYPSQGTGISDLTNIDLKNLRKVQKPEGAISLGQLGHGECRHRSILFKYLADRVGIPSRLVRGNYGGPTGWHVWNVVKLQGKFYIVDVMNEPLTLIEEGTPAAEKYKRQGRGGRGQGGLGGGSVTMVRSF